jgi:hypothetical protein
MAYVSPDCPLPRNSFDLVTACEAARAKETVSSMEQSVSDAYRASRQIASPQSFAHMGQPVVDSAVNGQRRLKEADVTSAPKMQSSVRREIADAPTVLPLNVSPDEYDSCCNRGTNDLMPVQASPAQRTLTMPQRAPILDLARADGQPSRELRIAGSGLGAVWGDAASVPCGATWPGAARPGISGKTLALLGLVGLGLYAASRDRGR